MVQDVLWLNRFPSLSNKSQQRESLKGNSFMYDGLIPMACSGLELGLILKYWIVETCAKTLEGARYRL
jgi:hypothetical protein